MRNVEPPVILLDCDTRAIEGIIYSFGKRGIELVGLSTKEKPPAFYSRYIKHKYKSPAVKEEKAYLNFLLDLPHKGVLLYADDASAAFVCKFADVLRKAEFLINIPAVDDFNRGFDKAQLFLATGEAGVPTIPTVIVNDFSDLEKAWRALDHPIILKATKLAGGKFKIIKQKEDLESAFQIMAKLIHSPDHAHMHSGLIAQEFIDYTYEEIYCCEAYYTTKSEPTGYLSIHKIRPNINRDGTAGGRLFAGETIEDAVLEKHTKAILDHLDWKGMGHLDWIYSKKYGQYLLCEINPRLPGFSNFLTKVNFEMAYYYYADLCNLLIPPYEFKKALYFEALRMPGDISTGIYAISKGYLPLKPFLLSYLRLFTFKHPVCIDIFYKSDPAFTLKSWSEHFLYILKRPFR